MALTRCECRFFKKNVYVYKIDNRFRIPSKIDYIVVFYRFLQKNWSQLSFRQWKTYIHPRKVVCESLENILSQNYYEIHWADRERLLHMRKLDKGFLSQLVYAHMHSEQAPLEIKYITFSQRCSEGDLLQTLFPQKQTYIYLFKV